jgi:hypothetical protein
MMAELYGLNDFSVSSCLAWRRRHHGGFLPLVALIARDSRRGYSHTVASVYRNACKVPATVARFQRKVELIDKLQ